MDPIHLRTQLQRNTVDLQDYCKDLDNWSQEMKAKNDSKDPTKIKTIRSQKKKPKAITEIPAKNESATKVQRLGGGDYDAWNKYDADLECEKLDNEKDINLGDCDELSDEVDEDVIEQAIAEKDEGNQLFKSKKYKEAIEHYTKAIELYAYDPVFFANRAICHIKLEQYKTAENDCTSALHLDKTYVKAYQRRAVARENISELNKARDDILKVFDYEPNNKESKEVLARLESKLKIDKPKVNLQKEPRKTSIEIKPTPSTSKNIPDLPRPQSKFAQSRQHTDFKPSREVISAPVTNTIIERKSPAISTGRGELNWPTHENIKVVKSVFKPPVKRSQAALKRLKVTDATSLIKETTINTPPTIQTSVIITEKKHEEVNLTEKSSTDVNYDLSSSCLTHDITGEDFTKLNLPVPKSSVQFYFQWKSLSGELRYLYLRQINPNDLDGLFKDSLESAVFSEILQVLAHDFVVKKKSVFPYLYGLSKVKRFSTLIMFKSTEDKIALSTLTKYIKENDDKFSKDVEVIIKKYEM